MDFRKDKGSASALKGTLIAGLVAGAGVATTAAAQDMRYSVGLPETSYNYDAAVFFADEIARTSDMNVEVFALSLLTLGEIPGGVRDGLSDFGFTLFPYFPAEFSELNLPANLSWLASSATGARWPGAAMIGATTEYVMLNCPDCLEQLEGFNAVYLAAGAAIQYGLACNTPVTSLDDIEGLRIRTGAADSGRFVENYGGISVAISGNEIYDALSTGNIDCTTVPPETLVGMRLMEVADHFSHMMPGNMFSGIGIANMNRDSWARLSVEQRQVILDAAAQTGVNAWMLARGLNQAAIDDFTAAGNTLHTVSEEDQARIAEYVQADLAIVRDQFANTYRVENVDEKIETIVGLIDKWIGLTNEVEEMELAAFTELYQREIYSQIDVSTFGID